MKNLVKRLPPFSIKHLLLHAFAIVTLDILLLYFLRPEYPIPCLFFSLGLWLLTLEDFRTQLIDLRVVTITFLLGILMQPSELKLIFFLATVGFFVPHLFQELTAKIEPVKEGQTADFHFQSSHSIFDEDNAPPYLPCLLTGLFVSLFYYLLVLPIPPVFSGIHYVTMISLRDLLQNPLVLLGIPSLLFLLSLGFSYRNRRAFRQRKNVVYKGLGDGDIYVIGMLCGTIGPFALLAAIVVSLIPSFIQIRLMERRKESCGTDV